MGDIKFYSPVDFDDTSSGVTIEGELNANDAAYFYHSTQTENLRIKGSVIAGSRNNQTSYANSINLGTNSMDIKARSNIFQLINGVNKLTVSENYIVLDENTSIAAGALPAARLHVRGSGITSATSSLIVQNSATTELFRVRDDGNVGIGTTSPDSKLHIADSSAIITLQDNNSTGNTSTSRIDFKDNGTFGTIGQIGFLATDDIEIKNNHTGNILLTGGNVGIGTTSPGVKLDVAGQIRASSGLEISGGNINLVDNSRIRLGSSADFQIYHDGSNSYITDTGTGDLYIRGSNSVYIGNNAGTKTYISGTDGGATKLYYNGAGAQQKLETTTTGVSVTGTATATTFLGDLNGTINTATTGTTQTTGNNSTLIATTAYADAAAAAVPIGNYLPLAGGTMTGNIKGGNAVKLLLGAGDVFQLYNDGNGFLRNYTGNLYIDQNTDNGLITFRNDDGAGGIGNYFILDGNTTHAYFSNPGNVGIGTSNPASRFHIYQPSGATGFRLTRSNNITGVGINIVADSTKNKINGYGDLTFGTAATGNGTNASERMRITSGGKVLIGVTSNQTQSKLTSRQDGSSIEFGHSNQSGQYYGTLGAMSSSGSPFIAFSADNTNSNTFTTRGAKGFVISQDTNISGDLIFSSVPNANLADQSLVERMRITSSGNVGIGTTNPATWKLSVDSSSVYAASFDTSNNVGVVINGNNTTASQIIGYSNSASTYNELHLRTNSTTSDGLYIDSSGNVGIGTTSPDHKLRVNGDARIGNLHIKTADFGTQGTGKTIYADAAGGGVLGFTSTTAFDFSNGITSRMRITSGGNVGIGTTNPQAKLEVASGDLIINNSGGKIDFRDGSGSSRYFLELANSNADLQINDRTGAGSVSMTIQSGGNVGIGTTSPSQKLDVAGNISLRHTTEDAVKFGSAGDLCGTSSANSVKLQKPGRSQYFLFGTQTGYFQVSDGTNNILLRAESTPEVNIYNTGALNYTQHSATNNNNGNVLTWSNSTSGNGERGRVSIVGDLRLDDYSSGSAVNAVNIENNGDAYFSGNVGIGTASPGAQLHIGSPEATPGGTAGTVDRFIVQPYSNTGGPYIFKARTVSGSEDYLDLYYGSNQIISYGLNGNVGIGTTSPDYKLDVEGSVNGDVDARIYNSFDDNNASSTPKARLWLEAASNNGYLRVHGAPADTVSKHQVDLGSSAGGSFLTFTLGVTERMRITNSGNIGIGITNPSEKLSIATSTNVSAEIGYAHVGYMGHNTYAGFSHVSTNTTTGYALLQASSGETYINAPTGQNINFRINNSTHMVLDSGGNIGIGTTSPSRELDVAGDAKVSGQTHTGTLRVDATAAGPTPAPNQSPSDAIVRPAGDTAIYLSEPEEWLEININGVDYVIPAYL